MTTQAKIANAMDLPLRIANGVWDDWMRQALAISAEILNFTMARVSEDFNALEELAACKDPVQFFNRQQEFVRTVAEDYAAEGQKIGHMMFHPQTKWSLVRTASPFDLVL
jgi:Phasin protein